jgi:DNA-binding CsgD family transcriptional regulator
MSNRTSQCTPSQKEFILEHAEDMTAVDIAKALNVNRQTVYMVGYRANIKFKGRNRRVKESPPIRERRPVPAALLPEPEKPKVARAKAEYSNSGYLNLLNSLT